MLRNILRGNAMTDYQPQVATNLSFWSGAGKAPGISGNGAPW